MGPKETQATLKYAIFRIPDILNGLYELSINADSNLGDPQTNAWNPKIHRSRTLKNYAHYKLRTEHEKG